MFCSSRVSKFVITVDHALTEGPSGTTAGVLVWENPGWLGVCLLLAYGTQRQSHCRVASRPTPKSYYGIAMVVRSTPPLL